MSSQTQIADETAPITGRRLTLPQGRIFCLQRSGEADHVIGAFRQWAGYKDLGSDAATDGLVLFQHVLSFGPTETGGRTGIHCHLAHVHIVIPTSGLGVFSYDGVVTEAAPGSVIVQHGGTIHDQFSYSYKAASGFENRRTPQSVDPPRAGEEMSSFGFLEFFVPRTIADVEVVAPEAVSEADQATAWNHPYHAADGRYFIQPADAPGGAYRPVAGRGDLEARDAQTWSPSGNLVATWIIRAAQTAPSPAPPISLGVPGETGGLDVFYMLAGSARFSRTGGEAFALSAGDCLTASHGLVDDPMAPSPDMRLIRFFVAARAQLLRERTPAEIEHVEALGPRIITARAVRRDGDTQPVNFMHDDDDARPQADNES